jgi:hypothetical protein
LVVGEDISSAWLFFKPSLLFGADISRCKHESRNYGPILAV